MRIMRHGLQVSEMAARKLPFKPSGIWTIRQKSDDPFSKYIVLSGSNKTMVLSISNTIQTVTDSGLDLNKQTLHTDILEDNCIIQVSISIHFIRPNSFMKKVTPDAFR